jgi:leader peptidase (prepilin peptidase)/N-methyltransferase
VTWHLGTAIGALLYGVLVGNLVPMLIARVPEPEAETTGPADAGDTGDSDPSAPVEEPTVEEPKELYADIARLRRLRTFSSLATGVIGFIVGGAVGWNGGLYSLLYLAPVGVALAVIDWRTKLLPTKLIAPSYVAVIVLSVVAALSDNDRHALVMAGVGWLVAGGTYFVLWFIYPRGMGYGDVRLSGVLGIALGYLGWATLLTGVYAGFLLGGFGGLVLSLLKIVDRKANPFGPFMLVGAVVGVALGPVVASWYS